MLRLTQTFGPGAEVSKRCHQCNPDDAYHSLHPYIIRNFHERYVGQECKKDTEAEYFKRLLTALDYWPERGPLQTRPVARHKSCEEDG
jgi:hypothetical protein